MSRELTVLLQESVRFQASVCLLVLVYILYEVLMRPRIVPTLIILIAAFISFCAHAAAGFLVFQKAQRLKTGEVRSIHRICHGSAVLETCRPSTCALVAYMIDVLLMTTGLPEIQGRLFLLPAPQPFVLFFPALRYIEDTYSTNVLYAWQRAFVLNTLCTYSSLYLGHSRHIFRTLTSGLLLYTGIVWYFKVTDVIPMFFVGACQFAVFSRKLTIDRTISAPQETHTPEDKLHATEACSAWINGDCLPTDTLVWVKGENHFQFLRDVAPGEKVLCFDQVSQSTAYAGVQGVRLGVSDSADWVTVCLEDGTEQVMTTYHPLQPKVLDASGIWTNSSAPVYASDLQPQVHSLMVLKTMPVPVASVRPCHATNGNNRGNTASAVDKITLTLDNPVRYSVFVAPPRVGNTSLVAVGAANLGLPKEQTLAAAVRQRGTHRAVSEPHPANGEGFWISDSSSSVSSTGSEDVILLLSGVTARRPQLAPQLDGGTAVLQNARSSYVTLEGQASSSVPTPRAKPGPYWNKSVSLQQTLQLTKNGIRSNGSLAHSLGTCSACVFETRYRRGSVVAPCRNGMLCDRCHEPHDTSHAGRRRRRSFSSSVPGSTLQGGVDGIDEDNQADSDGNMWSI